MHEEDAGHALDSSDAGVDDDGGERTNDGGEEGGAGQAFVLRFKGKVGSASYGCNQRYAGQGTPAATVSGRDFRFFVSNVRLIDAQGREVPLLLDARPPVQHEEVALIDLQDPDGSCGGAGEASTRITGVAPPGDYRGVAFDIGVPEALNHGDPALAPQPLRGSGMSWGWLQGYRFLISELSAESGSDAGPSRDGDSEDAGLAHGASDGGALPGEGGAPGDAAPVSEASSGGGAHDFEPGLGLLHLGSTGCLGSPASGIRCSKSNRAQIRLSDFDPQHDAIIADIAEIFRVVDVATGLQCHGRGAFCAPMFSALGVDLESGAAGADQRVFRVE